MTGVKTGSGYNPLTQRQCRSPAPPNRFMNACWRSPIVARLLWLSLKGMSSKLAITLSKSGATESRARWRRARQTAIGSPQGEPSVRRERINRDDVIHGKLVARIRTASDRRRTAAPHLRQTCGRQATRRASLPATFFQRMTCGRL